MVLVRKKWASVLKAGVLAVGALCSGAAYADEFNFVSLDFPPIIINEAEPKGIAVELVKETFKRMGHTANVKVQPWARSLEDVKAGQADAIFTAYKTPEREQFLDFSTQVVVPQKISVFVSKASGLTKESMGYTGDPATLTKYRVGARLKISYGSIVDDMFKNNKFPNVDMVSADDLNFHKLVNGRVDLLFMNRYVAWDLAKKLGYADKIMELDPPVQDVPSFIAFSKAKNLAGLRDKFDETFKTLVQDGTVDKVINSYIKAN